MYDRQNKVTSGSDSAKRSTTFFIESGPKSFGAELGSKICPKKLDSLRLFESFLDKSLALVFVDDGDDFGFVFENFNRALLRFAHLKTKKEIETSSWT